MKVSEYITSLVYGEVSKLAMANVGDMSLNPTTDPTEEQLTNQAKLVDFINQANLAIHKRFLLIQKDLELDNPVADEEYKLPDDFLVPISAYYTEDGEEVSIRDTSIKMVDGVDMAVSILMPEPFLARIKGTDSLGRSQIILRYAASPKKATKASSSLEVSDVYTEAILAYAAYKAHGSVNSDLQSENNSHYLRYEASCKKLVENGMWGNNEIETNTKLEDRGFI